MEELASIQITCNHPGGNVKVNRLSPGRAEIESDLRDTPTHWFYWNFEAKVLTPGKIEFHFPVGKQWLSAQGPCVSTDDGKTWRWAGKDKCFFCNPDPTKLHDGFVWEFTHAGENVRFAQGFPYQRSDFDDFVQRNNDNRELHAGILTKSRHGRECPMLTIGSGDRTMLLSCRHHACEATAAHVLEGFVAEAIADNTIAAAFRKEYTLFVIPFMDIDGVEDGDQGKGRAPHDHNRDYGLTEHLYPEVAAVEELHKKHPFNIVLDFHDPAVRSDDCLYPGAPHIDAHEHFYFGGYRSPSNEANTQELIRWLAEELPAPCKEVFYFGGKTPLTSNGFNGLPSSYYFGDNPTVTYGITLEIPYANQCIEYDSAMMRDAGQSILHALLRFAITNDATPRTEHGEFQKFAESLQHSSPETAEQLIADPATCGLYKAEAHLYLAQRGKDQAIHAAAVLASPDATRREKEAAKALLGYPTGG